MRAWVLLSAVLVVAVLASCGERRLQPPDPRIPAAPLGQVLERFPRAGLSFTRPGNWLLHKGPLPLVASVSSSGAEVNVWRYPRLQPLPSGHAALEKARRGLIAAARARDSTLVVSLNRVVRLFGYDAISLVGNETVGSERRQVVSIHIFAYRAEVVIDVLAPRSRFRSLNQTVFTPMLGSLRVFAPLRRRPRRLGGSSVIPLAGPSGPSGPVGSGGLTGP